MIAGDIHRMHKECCLRNSFLYGDDYLSKMSLKYMLWPYGTTLSYRKAMAFTGYINLLHIFCRNFLSVAEGVQRKLFKVMIIHTEISYSSNLCNQQQIKLHVPSSQLMN